MQPFNVRQNTARSRFELDVDGQMAIANYRVADGVIAITHTEVPQTLRGRGTGARLVLGLLEIARQQGLKVRPLCSFARFVIAQHPEVHDLLA
jgi:predicted GNAT family acetyltransferase